MRKILRVINVKKSFPLPEGGAIEVLRGVFLEISEGEKISIMGASGSGKTTLLHIIAGLETPDSGEVFINGKELYSINLKERALLRNKSIGMVFQFFNLLQEFSVSENIAMPLIIRGVDKKKAINKAEELLRELELYEKRNYKPSMLSGGEKQRVSLLRAIIGEPEVLLLDEPTGNLDEKTAEEVINFIVNTLNKKRIAGILVTHNSSIAEKFGEVRLLKHGIIE